MNRSLRSTAFLALVALPGVAMAHPGHGVGGGLVSGLLHPLTGADHLAAMLLAGVWAGMMGSRAMWMLPFVLLGSMLAGFFTAALVPPAVAGGLIGATLGGRGLVALARLRPPLWLASAAVALAGLGHGFAHGLEAPDGTARAGFVIGFLATAAVLQLAGLGLARFARQGLSLRRGTWHKAS